MMGSKVIYFVVGGKEEQAEFKLDACSEDVKGNLEGFGFESRFYVLSINCWGSLDASSTFQYLYFMLAAPIPT